MSDIISVCSDRGVKVGSNAPIDRQAFDLLLDLENLFNALAITAAGSKKILGTMNNGDSANNLKPLSAEGKQIVYNVFANYRNEPASKIFARAIDKRKTDGPKSSRLSDIETLAAIVDAAKKVEAKAGKFLVKLSARAKRLHGAMSSGVSVSKGIRLTINLLKRKVPAKFKVRVNAAAKAGDISVIILGICGKHKYIPRRVVKPRNGGQKPKPKPKPTPPPWYSKLDYSARLGSGFAHMITRPESMETLAAEPRGALARGGISASYRFNPKYKLQLDYNSEVPFGVIGDDKEDRVVSNFDSARISAMMNPINRLKMLAQLGWQYYRNDYPGERVEDLNVFTQKLRLNYEPIDNLSVNIDENLQVGWINQSFPADKQFAVRALFNAGASYAVKLKALSLVPFAGGTIGYLMDRELLAYGGYLGMGIEADSHEANVLASYNNVKGLTTTARYFYNTRRWGVGVEVFYNLYKKGLVDTELKEQTVGATITGRADLLKVKLLGEKHFGIKPFVRYAHELNSGANVALGGLEFAFGGLLPARPSMLRPYSLQAFPEEK
ncbi:MAG: hypothetical protein U9R38_06430 [Candidatus Margulisiibacteriota bacterium]|nr:hypothetical protein [Candidatus Margulisiibacteriota bacterium]